jgi:hypothetical protein
VRTSRNTTKCVPADPGDASGAPRIDSVEVPGARGIIGMVSCPGWHAPRHRSCPSGPGGASGLSDSSGTCGANSLETLDRDLEAIKRWGAEILLSLMQPREYEAAGIAAMADRMPPGILRIEMPIEDASIPDADWERSWDTEGPKIRAVLSRGGKICVHCMGGLGRTGLIVARILIEFGQEPELAISMVRQARPGAIETRGQEDYLRSKLESIAT